jgi:hypothetical protein|uniref:Uncharacterized protein n=1 Tax=Myoviridae sp. ctshb19 TaxID=2825194 RepID=A0A8S5UH47_9CAUD|nr:MAG TPA: hypothetical protein [Myoviridae sp. ctshb19]
MEIQLAVAAVSMRSALKYRRDWNKHGPTVQLLRKFMPHGSSGFRLYIPIGGTSQGHVVAPVSVRKAVAKAGYRITDYLAKKCVKLADKEQKNVFNIGKVIAKDPVAKAAFDNDPQLQNSKTSEFTMVVSCHPYDIIGMSTGRDWDNMSCMRLRDNRANYTDGINKHYLEHDIAEGTLVAYAVRTNDLNVQEPLGRCLLKPFLLQDDERQAVKYRRETRIYGNPVPGFADTMNKFIRKLNAGIPDGIYRINQNLYDDGVGGLDEHVSSEGGQINWAIVDDEAALKENPGAAASYAAYMVQAQKANGNDPYMPLKTVCNTLQRAKVPPRQAKHAAQVFVQSHEDCIKDLMEQVFYFDGPYPDGIDLLMANREFRKLVHKHADQSYKDILAEDSYDDVLARSIYKFAQLSPKAAVVEAEKALNDDKGAINVAYSILTDSRAVPRRTIVANPLLHKFVVLYAQLVRDSSLYGEDKFLTQAESMLGQLPDIDTKLDEQEFKDFVRLSDTDRTEGMRFILPCLALRCIDQGRVDQGYEALAEMSMDLDIDALLNRRSRKRLQKIQDQSIQQLIKDKYTTILRNIYRTNDQQRRELTNYLKESGHNLGDIQTWRDVIFVDFRLFPYVWFEEDIDNGEALMGEFNSDYSEWNKVVSESAGMKPRNEFQKVIFDYLYTYYEVTNQNPPPFGEVTDEALEALEEAGVSSRAIVDVMKYPQFLNEYTALTISPYEFAGKDLGHSYLELYEEKLDIATMANALYRIFSNGTEFETTARMCGATDVEMQEAVGAFGWFRNRTKEQAQRIKDFLPGYEARIRDFAETFPEAVDDREKMLDAWHEYFPTYKRHSIEQSLPMLSMFLRNLRRNDGMLDEIGAQCRMVKRECEKVINAA